MPVSNIFNDRNGECKDFVDQDNAVSGFYKIDQQLSLLIGNNNPRRVIVNGFSSLYLSTLFILGFSGICAYMAMKVR